MIIKGLKIKGIKQYPNFIKEAEIQPHKFGAEATVSYNTDQLKEDYAGKEILGFKHNMNLHAFITPLYNDQSEISTVEETGLIGMGIYYQTEYWWNPILDKFERIPDFVSSVWTQASVNAGLIDISMVGQSKSINYPLHGQAMYDLTNGKYGYDYVNGVEGEIDVLGKCIDYYVQWFKNKFGYYPSTMSYGYGRIQPRYKMGDYVLSVRNSEKDGDNGDYDFDLVFSLSRPQSEGVDYLIQQGYTKEQAINQCNTTLDTIIQNGGYYTDFSHWHNISDDLYQQYLHLQKDTIGARNVNVISYNDAIEYQFLRRMAKKAGIYEKNNTLHVLVDYINTDKLNVQSLNAELSVKVDVTGTILENKEIESDYGRLFKVSTNIFMVQVPYDKQNGFETIELKETTNPNYIDFSLPTISASKTGDVINVNTDIPTKIVLYSVPAGGELYQAEALERDNVISESHEIDVAGIDFTNLDIYIGAISEEKQANLSQVYNF